MIFKEKEPSNKNNRELYLAEYAFMNKFKKRISIFLRLSIALTLLVHLNSCYSAVEGCTDPESTNFAVSADDLCEDCCEYPEIKLSIFHENADTTFNLKDTITNDIGQQVLLLDFVYLLSDFEIHIGEESFEVSDSISLNVSDGVQYVKDDAIRVARDVFSFDLGTIIYDSITDNLSFNIGLSNLLNENGFTTEVDDHALTNDPDSLYQSDSGTYIFQRIQVAQGIDFLDTVVYDISIPVIVSFPIDFKSTRGEDKTIIIEAQYDKWFEEIDFTAMSKEEITLKIALNSSTKLFRQKN